MGLRQHGPWTVDIRLNKAGNLAIEVSLDEDPHAEFILQEDGVIDVGTKAKPWDLGDVGWEMPGAPTPELRKFRFSPWQ